MHHHCIFLTFQVRWWTLFIVIPFNVGLFGLWLLSTFETILLGEFWTPTLCVLPFQIRGMWHLVWNYPFSWRISFFLHNSRIFHYCQRTYQGFSQRAYNFHLLPEHLLVILLNQLSKQYLLTYFLDSHTFKVFQVQFHALEVFRTRMRMTW